MTRDTIIQNMTETLAKLVELENEFGLDADKLVAIYHAEENGNIKRPENVLCFRMTNYALRTLNTAETDINELIQLLKRYQTKH